MKEKIIIPLTIFQIFLVVYLGFAIFKKTNPTIHVLGIQSKLFNKYQKIQRKPGDPLFYFTEFTPGRTINSQDKWLNNVTYTINSDTLNERFDYPHKKPPNTFRVITLGDSFTMGRSVSTPENYPETLERTLNQTCQTQNIKNYEVINLGVWGYDIEHAVKRFKKRGKKYSPDLVLWFLIYDDFTDVNEYKFPIQEKYLNQYTNNPTYKNYQKAIKLTMKEYRNLYSIEQNINYNKKALPLINQHYQGNLVFLTFPFLDQEHQKIIKNFTPSRKNTYYFSNLPDIYTNKNTTLDDHPNKTGYQNIAKTTFQFLKSNQLLPCK